MILESSFFFIFQKVFIFVGKKKSSWFNQLSLEWKEWSGEMQEYLIAASRLGAFYPVEVKTGSEFKFVLSNLLAPLSSVITTTNLLFPVTTPSILW